MEGPSLDTSVEPGRAAAPMVELQGVNAFYGAAHILFDVTLRVHPVVAGAREASMVAS